ncbi:hypothetical protein B0O99DRAFT_101245 [Bisporella sp. PMI_857]|nr:hypothetical protein B0O99DRAFT_101245 [Bisporella sp. PMI_857]
MPLCTHIMYVYGFLVWNSMKLSASQYVYLQVVWHLRTPFIFLDHVTSPILNYQSSSYITHTRILPNHQSKSIKPNPRSLLHKHSKLVEAAHHDSPIRRLRGLWHHLPWAVRTCLLMYYVMLTILALIGLSIYLVGVLIFFGWV